MGGGIERAERDATRGWERRCMTGTAVAVAALAVLGTLQGSEESRSGAYVAFGRASVAQPDNADAGAGQCERAIDPVGGDKNRHGSSEWYESAHNGPRRATVSRMTDSGRNVGADRLRA